MNLPANLPPLPPVPEGFDRWEYRGTGWKTDQFARYAYLDKGDQGWGVHSREYIPHGSSGTHYLEAVRDEPATPSAQLFALLDPENGEDLGEPAKDQPEPCTECVQGYVQDTGFNRCEKCNPADQPATSVEAKVCKASGVATWNPLDHGIQGAPLMVPAHAFNRAISDLERKLAEARTALEDIKDHDGGNRYNYREITQLAEEALARIDGNPQPADFERHGNNRPPS